ncbi:MAG: EamA family transporter [Krumholzibacteria bacterium]|nr:EamA family transporter [Candidatus Krumholzibacteria bacterium]
MTWLVAASLLFAFSFGLIKGQLAGVDPVAVSAGRLVLAAAAFAPLLGRVSLHRKVAVRAFLLGMLQFGLMYVLYISAFARLPAWLVALLTVFTPIYVTLLADLFARRFRPRHLAAAAAAVAGAGFIVVQGLPEGVDWPGVALVQGSNLCFALGQVAFPGLQRRAGGHEAVLVAWMYQGAALLTLVAVGLRGGDVLAGWDGPALLTVLYLGLVPTAAGFYLWNRGATRTGAGRLAAANNLKVPLAVLISWWVFGESADYLRVLLGLAVVTAALFLAGRRAGETSGGRDP